MRIAGIVMFRYRKSVTGKDDPSDLCGKRRIERIYRYDAESGKHERKQKNNAQEKQCLDFCGANAFCQWKDGNSC